MPVDAQMFPARAVISTEALEHNLNRVRQRITGEKIMAIIKADAYGHGMWRCAQAFSRAGADYLGVAQLAEAVVLARRARQESVQLPPIFSWIFDDSADLCEALELGIELSVGTPWALRKLEETLEYSTRPARIHIAVDTGMSREGFAPAELPNATRTLARLEQTGRVTVVGVWSHLACADTSDTTTTHEQIKRFRSAIDVVHAGGVEAPLEHLAASGGALWYPEARFAMVRPGILLYGLSPEPAKETAEQIGLIPAMRLESSVIAERTIPAGQGVSYGHTFVSDSEMKVGIVPLGYADGIPRHASNVCEVLVDGRRARIRGRVCMDQCVVELPEGAGVESRVVMWGDPGCGEPGVWEWAEKMGTIGYEITTRLASRVPRVDE